ncbi:MAG TPA: TauD/TfdA family dioxygenase [Stellaceae bacterium]|nr:TauD/TfdA family dioxygenase [Stellaceae bacterium]
MTLQVKPLTGRLGAEITGIDLARPLADSERQRLYGLFAEHAVLVLRDQEFDPPHFAAAAQIFGEIIPEQFPNYRLPEYPTVSFLSNRDLEQTGKRRAVRGEGFHTDHSNYAAPPKATILYGIVIPHSGGDTEFVSAQAAYDDLSVEDKRRVAGLKAIHAYRGTRDDHKATVLSPEQLAKTPRAAHPIARLNPDNGRVGLYLSPNRVIGIEGMDEEAAFALLGRLFAHATQPKYLYRHKWRKGDMVLWDNRSVLHQATSDYDMEEYRYLYRVLLGGEAPIAAPPPRA